VSAARAIAPDPGEERPENEYHGHQLRAKGEKSKITNSCERTHGDYTYSYSKMKVPKRSHLRDAGFLWPKPQVL
jgi:hypothetical protein